MTQQSSSKVSAPTLLTLRNLWRRKANQLVSIFSATDSVLGKPGGHTCHTQNQTTYQRPQMSPSGTAQLHLGKAPVMLRSRRAAGCGWRCRPHRTELTAHHSPDGAGDREPGDTRLPARGANYSLGSVNHWDLQRLLAIREQHSDNGSKIAAFSPVPPSILSPHCARDYL